mmetsp:Transcript_2155/g.2608  ORF Transcript_2155/g.2608 Transcript_2155/m.2608 type:complete len:243 (-) Transcript_2155:210-938(-)
MYRVRVTDFKLPLPSSSIKIERIDSIQYLLCLGDLEQFNLEDESSTRGDGISTSCITVSKIGGNDKSCLATFLHHGKTFLPSLNDLSKGERDCLATFYTGIEDGTIGEGTMVVNLNGVFNGGLSTLANDHGYIDQTTLSLCGIFIAGQKVFNKFGSALLHEFLNVGGPFLQDIIKSGTISTKNCSGILSILTLHLVIEGFKHNIHLFITKKGLETTLNTNLCSNVYSQSIERHFVFVVGGRS